MLWWCCGAYAALSALPRRMSPSWINWEGEEGVRYTAHYTVPDWQCLHSGLGHGVRAHQDVLKEAHSGILCILPIRYSSAGYFLMPEK